MEIEKEGKDKKAERERQGVRERDEIDRVRDRKREEWDTEGYKSTESVIDTGCEAEY